MDQGGSTRQESLRAITDPALASLPVRELLAELAARACTVLGSDDCAIVVRGGRVYGSDRPELRDLADRAIADGEMVADATGIGVPLRSREQTFGAVVLLGAHPSDADVDALHIVAARAVVGLEHERAVERLQALQSVTDAALAHLELEDLLNELLLRIRSILGADTAAILMLDEPTNELVARAAKGIEEEVEAGVRIPLGRGFAGRVAAERRPILLPDVDHADVLNPILRDKGIKTLLGVPLLIEGNPIGVLHVGTLAPHDFGPSDVDVLQLVADRAALAIEHARAFEAERLARRRLEDVQSVTDATIAHLELEDLLDELLLRIRSILSADTAAILLLDEDRNELVARAAKGIEEEVEAGVRIPVGGGFAGRVAASRVPVILPTVDMNHVLNPILIDKGIKTLLGVPLIVSDKVIGVLHVGTLTHRIFTTDDVQLLQLVAERAAVAIERARLLDETRELDELQRNFVAIASHELRTPAASVYGALATLRGRRLPPETRAQLEEIAWQESDRMRRLIEQLLDLSRLDSGRVRLEPQRVDVTSFLTGLVGTDPDIAVQPADDVAASLDPLVLERVLSNLVGNARTYGRPPITLCASRDRGELKIIVEDSGEGVPMELVPRLFDRFVRGGEGHGTGLGLAIARAYTRAHGGELRYARGSRGARFEVVLPGA